MLINGLSTYALMLIDTVDDYVLSLVPQLGTPSHQIYKCVHLSAKSVDSPCLGTTLSSTVQ